MESIDNLLEIVATVIEIGGVAVIVFGAAAATLRYAQKIATALDPSAAFKIYRSNLGRAILLGLELLVAADIIGTVALEPSFETVGVLALIVLIRTFLSFSLEVEIEGAWPWQRAALERRRSEKSDSARAGP